MPAAMFNGHLTSANSDVRAGNNHERHNGRWGGFVAWWQGVFGSLTHQQGNTAGPGMTSTAAVATTKTIKLSISGIMRSGLGAAAWG